MADGSKQSTPISIRRKIIILAAEPPSHIQTRMQNYSSLVSFCHHDSNAFLLVPVFKLRRIHSETVWKDLRCPPGTGIRTALLEFATLLTSSLADTAVHGDAFKSILPACIATLSSVAVLLAGDLLMISSMLTRHLRYGMIEAAGSNRPTGAIAED